MTSRWIVGIDGSSEAVDALAWAMSNARGRDVDVTALSAYHVPARLAIMTAKRGFGVDELGLQATAAHDVDEAIAQAGADDTADGGITIEPLTAEGHPAHVLADAAADADMLIVGRSGDGGLRQHALGSVSRHCATHASAPVVVVPPSNAAEQPPGSPVRIAVGFDGSEHSLAALSWAMDFAPEFASISAIAAIEHAAWIGQDLTAARFPNEISTEELHINTAIDRVDRDHEVVRDIALRSPRPMLADASAVSDLMVLGTRGHGRIAAGLMGSVSAWMIERSLCPVVIVPDTEA